MRSALCLLPVAAIYLAAIDPVSRLSAAGITQPDAAMLEAVRRAHDAGVRTGLVSNSWGIHRYPHDLISEIFDGVARHTEEGYAFQATAASEGFKAAVRERDEPFGDLGRSTFKG